MRWPWQWRAKLKHARKNVAKLREENHALRVENAKASHSNKQLGETNKELSIQVHDLECEVEWLREVNARELSTAGAVAIVVSQERMDGFLSALAQMQRGGSDGESQTDGQSDRD